MLCIYKHENTPKVFVYQELISDILVALEGILKTENISVLIQAADVSSKFVSTLGNSVRQYPVMEIVSSLSCHLSANQLRICCTMCKCIDLYVEQPSYSESFNSGRNLGGSGENQCGRECYFSSTELHRRRLHPELSDGDDISAKKYPVDLAFLEIPCMEQPQLDGKTSTLLS